MHAWIRQVLFAGWALLAAWLGCEWLVPGSVSAFVPLFAGILAWTVLTLLVGPFLPPFRRPWAAAAGLAVPCAAVLLLLSVFSIRADAAVAFGASALLGALALAFVPAVFLPNERES